MSDESRVQQLVEETLDSERAPEEVCAEFPELLLEVRERVRQCQAMEAQIEAMFPPSSEGMAARRRRLISLDDSLPEIPGYLVEAVLGRGGVGVVYQAKQLKLNRYVALKMLLSGTYADPHELARFTREAEAVAGLRHCNIVQVYDVGEFDGKPYFTMEFMDGGSLAQKLAGSPQPALQAAKLLAALATAVQIAHVGGIIHRDLKPSNILLAADGMPKITDFGLARQMAGAAAITKEGAHVGTPSYMAPEQALGDANAIGPATDIYGLGAILYEVLTGRPPFKAESASETERQLISKEPVAPSRLNAKVPRDLETICLKCLRKEPERRYASAADLAEDLRRFLEGRPILARPLGWAGRMRRWAAREPAAAALIATIVVVFAMIVVGGFWAQRQRAQARANAARQEQAVEAALAHANDLRKLGHWPEALRALEGAPGLLAISTKPALRERLHRARADADMVVRLEDVRLRLSEGNETIGRASSTADQLYTEAFATYGISLTTSSPAEAAAIVRHSDIRDILLVFLHDWLYWATDASRRNLRALVEAADDDSWRRDFREARAKNNLPKLEQLARSPEAASQPPALISGLGGMLLSDGHRQAAWTLLRSAQQRHPADFWINYLLGHYLEEERPLEAVGYIRAAIAIRPDSDQAYTLLNRALRAAGDASGSADALHQAVALNPTRSNIEDLARLMASQGELEEVHDLWAKVLAHNPPNHDTWYGYAQLCLFLGKEDEYRNTRDAMLSRFEFTDDWITAERTSLASLLLPLSGTGLTRVAAVADRAVADARKSSEPDNGYVQFVKGLSEYRQDHFAQAASLLQTSAQKIPNRPGPLLVLAMTQFKSGSSAQAKKTLANVITIYDWKELHDDHATVWTSHILRREAERLILPNLPAFVQGKYQPQDNDERLALLGTCQSEGLYRAAAQLYADAFAADPALAERLTAECLTRAAHESDAHNRIEVLRAAPRYLAARCAAAAAFGLGKDTPALSEGQRLRLRERAREWLQADLDASLRSLNGGTDTTRDLVAKILTLWKDDSDLAELRESESLNRLPAQEKAAWNALWKQTDDTLIRAHSANH
jgi:serine/threonine-protein kinase